MATSTIPGSGQGPSGQAPSSGLGPSSRQAPTSGQAPSEPAPTSGRRTALRGLGEVVVLVAIAVVVAVVVRTFLFQAYYIPSASMEPELHINDRIVVSRLAYDLHGYHRGDIVVFHAPPGQVPPQPHRDLIGRAAHGIGTDLGVTSDDNVWIKRVIGLPGDTVQGYDGHVYVDGRLLIEPYLPPGVVTSNFGPDKVPAHDLWVMGDNRPVSKDSRYIGPITEHSVIGRAIWRIWPPGRVAFL